MTIYHSSTGPKDISEMGRDNAFHAAAKLRRDGFGDTENSEEVIEALDAHVAKLDAEFAEAVRPFKEAGYTVREDFDALGKRTYSANRTEGEGENAHFIPLAAGLKTEGAAWAALIAMPGMLA